MGTFTFTPSAHCHPAASIPTTKSTDILLVAAGWGLITSTSTIAMVAPHKRRPTNHGEFGVPQSDSSKARIFLLLACLWPMFILALFAASAPHHDADPNSPSHDIRGGLQRTTSIAVGDKFLSVKNILDRVDILGYGPTHPRVAVVVVGDNRDN